MELMGNEGYIANDRDNGYAASGANGILEAREMIDIMMKMMEYGDKTLMTPIMGQ